MRCGLASWWTFAGSRSISTPRASIFAARCQPDINAGYRAEVEEAFRRSFKIVAYIDGPGTNNAIIYEPIKH